MGKTINDAEFDELFEQAVKLHFEDMMAAIQPAEDFLYDALESTSVSEGHKPRVLKMFRRVRRMDMLEVPMRLARRGLVSAAAVFVVLFAALYTVNPAVRAAVGNIIIRWNEGFTNFTGIQQDEYTPPGVLRPMFIPVGYIEDETWTGGSINMIVYINEEGKQIIFTYMDAGSSSLSVSNTNVDYSLITEDGTDYHLFETTVKDNYNSVVWHKDGLQLHIAAEISMDELLKVVFSVVDIY